jgi:hypothetical protein
MLPKTIESYGGPYISAEPVSDPQTEQSAEYGNRSFEDLAQCTRTVPRAFVSFNTSSGGAGAISVLDAISVYGDSGTATPDIEKTATGTYTVTYATEYEDALVGTESDSVSETEIVSFRFGWGSARGSTFGHAQIDPADNVVTVYVFDAAGALSDLGGGKRIDVFLR